MTCALQSFNKAAMTSPMTQYGRIPQAYIFAFGTVSGRIFTPTSGAMLPHGLPHFWLAGEREGKPRGRPPKRLQAINKAAAKPAVTFAYGLDAAGQWYSVRYTADGRARARTVDGAPYSKMPRARRWSTAKLQQQAAEALHAATVAQLRKVTGCDLI